MEKFNKLHYEELETKKLSEFDSSFKISPLEKGMANTLGNALRRTLLSSVPGLAPFAVKIAGTKHEFQTLNGIREDVMQIILNLKTLRFLYKPEIIKDGEILKATISIKGKHEITGKDVTPPAGIEVIDSKHYIASVADGGSLDIELFLRSGRGFVSFDKNKIFLKKYEADLSSKLKSGALIAIDSDFSPIKKVAYFSEEINAASLIVQEKLTLNVTTDGSIDVKTGIAQAASILSQHLTIISDLDELEKNSVFKSEDDIDSNANAKRPTPISSLDLTKRSDNCLRRAGYHFIEDLANLTMKDLKSIKNLGQKSIKEIIEVLNEHGIVLEDND